MRVAVRRWLAAHPQPDELTVAVSGGADSLALCSAALLEARGRIAVHAVTVDHQLQEGSAQRAEAVSLWAVDAGCASAQVVTVDVGTRGGPEAAARDARYSALRQVGRGDVLLGHTLDDQAESVLLGLGRGSGRRSLQGMAPYDAPWGRPLLGTRRAQTRQYCADLQLPVWDDPHNDDPRFTRVRLRRQALPLLEEILGGGVAEALARTAGQLREDDPRADVAAILELVGAVQLDAKTLARFTEGTRRAVIKQWLDDRLGGPCTSAHVVAVDGLVARYRGQGPVYLPGGSRVIRERGRISHAPADSSGRAAPRTRPT
ncbi:tRNA lysidine(34) synthetase TilS [Blastococcus sp. Marseille-P5729]|uniref:tRNA lysidine(34) synthetase TilS n=1 Tax=Blastococcus sp. Marseille-P5729 TaxID=2086582 RepID=UPI001F3B97D9|nr:tRNA lysidine(34) synthetase TilS [Blastococcus sp. Marseille-P5729]